jgi:hypothetical protein
MNGRNGGFKRRPFSFSFFVAITVPIEPRGGVTVSDLKTIDYEIGWGQATKRGFRLLNVIQIFGYGRAIS